MGAGSAANPSIAATMPGVLGDDSSDSKGEDNGGRGGARSPSDMEVGGTNRHRTTDAQMLEESEDDVEVQSPALFWSATFRAMAQCTNAGTSSAILDSLYLGEDLLPVFVFCNCFIF